MAKFQGQVEDFKRAIEALKLHGSWEDFSAGLCYRTNDGGIIKWFSSTKTIQIQGNPAVREKLTTITASLDAAPMPLASRPIPITEDNITTLKEDKKIFIVHGHDTVSREQLELIIHKLGLEPFVLANSSGGGLTIIEALEKEIGQQGESAFGIVLLTPDDMGYANIDGAGKVQPRARQNVVLEMGMLIAAVGRRNTAILKKGHLETPSDTSGILYLSFNNHVKEVVPRLVERLRESGFDISASKFAKAAS